MREDSLSDKFKDPRHVIDELTAYGVERFHMYPRNTKGLKL